MFMSGINDLLISQLYQAFITKRTKAENVTF